MSSSPSWEFLIGGTAAAIAGVFTNPLEVAKTRMQLQGELAARGQYKIHYRNVFHAFYIIGRKEGVFALQKGLGPALWYQMVMSGTRLGAYQTCVNAGLTSRSDGRASFVRSVIAGAIAGTLGASLGSPLYLVKTHLQAQAAKEIAVGHQYSHKSSLQALSAIYSSNGIRGLWRGVSGAIPRVMVGSASQLTTFTLTKEWLQTHKIVTEGWMVTLLATFTSSIMVTVCMTPFDVVSLRLYNQPVDSSGKGQLYKGVLDCTIRMWRTEGFWGFYKGWGAVFFRLGPHSVISLFCWDHLRKLHLARQTAADKL